MITLPVWTQVWRDVNVGRHVASKSPSRWRGLARRGALVSGSALYVGIARVSQELVETFYPRAARRGAGDPFIQVGISCSIKTGRVVVTHGAVREV